MPRQALK